MIRYTPSALGDIDHAISWLAERNPEAADRLRAAFQSTIGRLDRFPHLGRPGRVRGTREISVVDWPYIVAYRLAGDDAQILAVRHARRRWPESFSEG